MIFQEKAPPIPTITDAVKALRTRLGDTQQQFAQRLGLAISTVVRYESTRPPKGAALAQLYAIAKAQELPDVMKSFETALLAEELGVGMPEIDPRLHTPSTPTERLFVAALLQALRSERHSALLPKIAALLSAPNGPAQQVIDYREFKKRSREWERRVSEMLDEGKTLEEIAKSLESAGMQAHPDELRARADSRDMQKQYDLWKKLGWVTK